MIHVDGSMGEGGGQVLRSSLALGLCLGRSFRVDRIRAGRKVPGLRAQHLECVHAAAAISSGRVAGARLGSTEIEVHPGAVRGGTYRFDTSGAGSATLVLQTVLLPLLLVAGEPSRLEIVGGTHNPLAPSFDFLERSFVPALARMGARVRIALERHGFAPGGGGLLVAEIEPAARLAPLELLERGASLGRRAKALVASLSSDIGARELATLADALSDPGLRGPATRVDARGPGNAVVLDLAFENAVEVLTAFGAKGVRAEQLARDLAAEARAFEGSGAPVGEHLADQLLLPMALGGGGGTFRASTLSLHARTQIDLLRSWTAIEIEAPRAGAVEADRSVTVRVPPGGAPLR